MIYFIGFLCLWAIFYYKSPNHASYQKMIDKLKAENAQMKETLQHIGALGADIPNCCTRIWDDERDLENHYSELAIKALKGGE